MNPAAFIFDAYGTLFDVASVGRSMCRLVLRSWTPCRPPARGAVFISLWRAPMRPATRGLRQVTADALDFAAAERPERLTFGCRRLWRSSTLRTQLRSEVAAAAPIAWAGPAECIILSNGSPSMLHAAVSNAGLAERFQAVVSVDAVRSYKPDPRVYQLGVDAFGGTAARLVFVCPATVGMRLGHAPSAYASPGSTVPKRRQNALASRPTSLSLTSPPLSPSADGPLVATRSRLMVRTARHSRPRYCSCGSTPRRKPESAIGRRPGEAVSSWGVGNDRCSRSGYARGSPGALARPPRRVQPGRPR